MIAIIQDYYQYYTAQELVHTITVGWCLGNTLDSTNSWVNYGVIGTDQEASYYETLFDNPVTTQAMIDKVREAGFNAIRIPVTWAHHIDFDNNCHISDKWMNRVEEVVSYAMNNNMICIINTHHDASNFKESNATGLNWIHADPSTIHEVSKKLHLVWTQIANRFKNYPMNLIFEAYNEVMTSERTWKPPTQEEYDALNKLAQTFVTTVRNTGGNNKSRSLCLNTYGATMNELQYFRLPNDSASNRLLVQIHNYDKRFNQEIEEWIQGLKRHFVDHGIPVIVGEFGTNAEGSLTDDQRVIHAKNFISRCKKVGIPCFWWDNGDITSPGASYGLLNRKTLSWYFPDIVQALIEGITAKPNEVYFLTKSSFHDISYWEEGSINSNGKIVAWRSSLHLISPIPIIEGHNYNIQLINEENGFRIKAVIWYDREGKRLQYEALNNGPTCLERKAPPNAKYMNFWFYNPWGEYSLSTYREYFTSGKLKVFIRSYLENVILEGDLETNLQKLFSIDNWKSGEYSYSNGTYSMNSHRICTKGYYTCNPSHKYKNIIPVTQVVLLVREYDANLVFIRNTGAIEQGNYFTTDKNTKYITFTLYSPTNPNITYSYYEKLFLGTIE